MRIILIVHRFHTNLFFPVKALIDGGHDVNIIVPRNELYDTLVEDHSFVKPLMLGESDLGIEKILKVLRELKPDLILHRHFKKNWKLFYLAAIYLRIKCITYNQDPHSFPNIFQALKSSIKRFIKLQPVYRITPVLNRGIRYKYSDFFSMYIPFPIEKMKGSLTRSYMENDQIRFLCVGKLGQPRKNHFQVLEALESLDVNCSLTFVGAGPDFALANQEYYNNLILKSMNSKISGGVKVYKDMIYKDILDLYMKHDILIMPAEFEAHGQCILEGLSAGCPVIATDDCGASSYIVDGFNGFIYHKNDVNELKLRIQYFFENKHMINIFGQNALHSVSYEHSPQLFCHRIEAI